ncbi:hypothetical protein HNQ60_002158 [Povalibacter uvarum]|uniref:Uncharacterized protein n=1 Tax=Povalibacter uvarum TaxID=732238 RepID=A0A841HLX1_9GAMM|nr:hypothetical protein [Povalibacter uvarum]MBB6093280.1 hypothetical protein [Povalibacter uvarum]
MNAAVESLHDRDAQLQAFEACTLPPAQFSHRLHLSFGWQYLQRYGFPAGAGAFCERLRAYVTAVGAAAKYHETITWAYLALMNEERVLRSTPGESFDSMILRRPDLLDHRSGALAQCYSLDQLDVDAARRVFVLPRAS